MGKEIALAVPTSTEMVTKETVDRAWDYYYSMAEEALSDAVFEKAEEKEAEIAQTILQLVEVMGVVSDNVRQRAINIIARFQLYRYTPEGWNDLQSMIQAACPSLSPSQLCEFAAINETIAPWCEQHKIELEMPPDRLGYLREAASALRNVIQSPVPNGQKARVIQEELEWLFTEAPTRRDVRNRYRTWRGTPAQGFAGEQDGMTTIVLRATPVTAAALRQKMGPLVEWDISSTLTARVETGALIPSKVDDSAFVQDHATILTVHKTIIIDGETGAIL